MIKGCKLPIHKQERLIEAISKIEKIEDDKEARNLIKTLEAHVNKLFWIEQIDIGGYWDLMIRIVIAKERRAKQGGGA